MTDKRSSDAEEHTWFRSPRVFHEHGQWFFYTREGKIEGPYGDEKRARECLEAYVRTMGSKFAPSAELELSPRDD